MLVLQLRAGQKINFYQNNKELGCVKYLKLEDGIISLGFDLPQSIKILRAELVNGSRKDTIYAKEHIS
jgi:sRNA-binding carbon storage regulator CsrA